MTKSDVATLVKIVDDHHVETLTKIEEVKADVAEVKADVEDIKGMLGDADEKATIGG